MGKEQVDFESFFAVVTEVEKRTAQEQRKPNLAAFSDPRPAVQPQEELVIEIDTKIIDVLKSARAARKG